jgi:oligoendopeptidase F
MNQQDVVSLIASVASLVLAVLAIWLSVVFYKMSAASSEQTKDAAKGIAANVDRLEKLFDRLYADTFSIMKDTVSDMRRHIWPDESTRDDTANEIEKRADEKIASLRQELVTEVNEVVHRQTGSDERLLQSLTQQFSGIVERAIEQSRKVEAQAREETLREKIMRRLRELSVQRRTLTADDFVFEGGLGGADPSTVVTELEKMKADGLIRYKERYLLPTSIIKFVN